jgi:hypothetical protein
MATTAKKTDPALWEAIKAEVTAGDKGGEPGQWSARKAQFASAEYRKKGGGYAGGKGRDNHLQQWTDEKWGTDSGKRSADTGERYLPESARESLTSDEYARTTAKKRADKRRGKQFSPQPDDVRRKTAPHREHGHADLASLTRAELLERARAAGVRGRTRMRKSALLAALS